MRSLAKLVATVRPDLVLFVGEALAGNDAVDQLAKFSARLADLSSPPAFGGGGGGGGGGGRGIDGVVLTKFDAVDDRVGAALSLAATSPAPVVFVGTGQGYGDLKRFQPRSVVRSLLA